MWDKSKENDLDLIFVCDCLLDNIIQAKFKLPIKFVSLAYVEGYKLFKYRKSVVLFGGDKARRTWGNDRVYGAIYRIDKPQAYLTLLDAYYFYLPSQQINKPSNNLRVRQVGNAHLFSICSLNDLLTYNYKSQIKVNCIIYTGNIEDKRLLNHIKNKRYRIVEGIDKVNYNILLKQLKIL